MALDADKPIECGQVQSATLFCNNQNEDHAKDAISSIVIAHVETVAEDGTETEENQPSSSVVEPEGSESAKRRRIFFNCDACDFCTTTRFSLARHLECHKQSASIPATTSANDSISNQQPSPDATKPGQNPTSTAKQVKMKIFKCSHCAFSSKFHFIMKKHLLTHLKRPTNHKCRYCPFEANSIRALLPHLVNKHRNYNETCPRCLKLVSLQLKSEHLQVCRVRNPTLQCSHCSYKTFNRKQLAKHAKNCGKRPDKMNKCNYCSFTSTCPRSLRDHTLLHTKLNRPIYQCTHCDYKSTKKNFENHVKSQHPGESRTQDAKPSKLFKCNQCSFTASIQFAMNRHALTHQNGLSEFTCKYCTFNGINKKSLQTHLGVAHKKFTQSCPHCLCQVPVQMLEKHSLKCRESKEMEYDENEDSESTSQELKQGSVSKERRFDCDLCTFTSSELENLERHMESHGEQLYKCPICEYRATRMTLTKHFDDVHLEQLTGNDIQKTIKLEAPINKKKSKTPWSCEFCSFTSFYSFTMKQHRLHHTDQNKPIFNCNHCDYKSIKKIVEKHSMVVHQIPYNYPISRPGLTIKKEPDEDTKVKQILFVCEICDYSTYSKEILFQHKLSHSTNESLSTNKNEETCSNYQRSFASNHAHKCRVGTNRYRIEYDSEGGSRMFYCNICEYKTLGRRTMNRHWSKTHQPHHSMDFEKNDHFLLGQNAPFKCETCDFQTNLEDSLQNHQVLHININKVKVYKNDTYNVDMANGRDEVSEEGSD